MTGLLRTDRALRRVAYTRPDGSTGRALAMDTEACRERCCGAVPDRLYCRADPCEQSNPNLCQPTEPPHREIWVPLPYIGPDGTEIVPVSCTDGTPLHLFSRPTFLFDGWCWIMSCSYEGDPPENPPRRGEDLPAGAVIVPVGNVECVERGCEDIRCTSAWWFVAEVCPGSNYQGQPPAVCARAVYGYPNRCMVFEWVHPTTGDGGCFHVSVSSRLIDDPDLEARIHSLPPGLPENCCDCATGDYTDCMRARQTWHFFGAAESCDTSSEGGTISISCCCNSAPNGDPIGYVSMRIRGSMNISAEQSVSRIQTSFDVTATYRPGQNLYPAHVRLIVTDQAGTRDESFDTFVSFPTCGPADPLKAELLHQAPWGGSYITSSAYSASCQHVAHSWTIARTFGQCPPGLGYEGAFSYSVQFRKRGGPCAEGCGRAPSGGGAGPTLPGTPGGSGGFL